jgi:hypothetical protein
VSIPPGRISALWLRCSAGGPAPWLLAPSGGARVPCRSCLTEHAARRGAGGSYLLQENTVAQPGGGVAHVNLVADGSPLGASALRFLHETAAQAPAGPSPARRGCAGRDMGRRGVTGRAGAQAASEEWLELQREAPAGQEGYRRELALAERGVRGGAGAPPEGHLVNHRPDGREADVAYCFFPLPADTPARFLRCLPSVNALPDAEPRWHAHTQTPTPLLSERFTPSATLCGARRLPCCAGF